MKSTTAVYITVGILFILPGCNSSIADSNESEEIIENEEGLPESEGEPEVVELTDSLYFLFTGFTSQNKAGFSFGNATTDTIQYSGYHPTTLFYDIEELVGDAWVMLFDNWCATGVNNFILSPDSLITTTISNPPFSCTWRVKMMISTTTSDSSWFIYSDGVEYVHDDEL